MKKILKNKKRIALISFITVLAIGTFFFFKGYYEYKDEMERAEITKKYVQDMEREIDETYSLPAEKNNFSFSESQKNMESKCPSKTISTVKYLECLEDHFNNNLKIIDALHEELFIGSRDILEEFNQNGIYEKNHKENPHQIFLSKLLPTIKVWLYSLKPVCDLEIEKNKNKNSKIVDILCNIDRSEKFIKKMMEMRFKFISSFIDYNAKDNNNPKTENYKNLLEHEKEVRKKFW